ncbi:MAG: hypothetical protein PHU76_01640 [Synergistaceae bacterium]|nr:hypothetical protein [Proteiniphilum sp.]MDD3963142.1 hypothetical protein [Synergistaceae bacterium]
MSHLTLTTKNGETQELSLPLCAEEYLHRPVPSFLAYGAASVTFDTPDEGLNEALADCMPEKLEGGIQELSLLAYILGKTDEAGLARIVDTLPDSYTSAQEVLQGIYSKYDIERFAEQHKRSQHRDIDSQRMTGGELFERFMERTRENGDAARFDEIGDYVLPDDMEKGKLCSYEFDMLPIVNFGGSEGIYIDCSLRGKFDESGRSSLHIGTLKTLSTDLDACKTMGELCGALMHYANSFVNENLYLFDSAESIERMLTKPLRIEQGQTEAPQLSSQQM